MTTEQPLRVGVMGTGAGARTHIPAWSKTDGADVTAVFSKTEERASQVTAQFGIRHAVTDMQELAGLDDVDLVVVATTPDLHYDAVMAAVTAGKHVLCEKPFALNADQARQMLSAAEASGVRHFMNHEFRMDPALQEMHRLIQDGFLGRLTHVQLSDFGNFVLEAQGILSRWWFREASAGGWLVAHGSHRVDELRFLFGEITEVSALLDRVVTHPQRRGGTLTSEVDDGYFLMFRFASGAIGVCIDSAATAVPVRGERLEAYGTDGTLVAEGDLVDGLRLMAARRGEALEELPLPRAEIAGLQSGNQFMHVRLNSRIVDAIRTSAPLHPNFEDGLRTQLVLDASRRSHLERRWIPVAP